MKKEADTMYWATNDEWYESIEDAPYYILHDNAPEEAKESYELWKKSNGLF